MCVASSNCDTRCERCTHDKQGVQVDTDRDDAGNPTPPTASTPSAPPTTPTVPPASAGPEREYGYGASAADPVDASSTGSTGAMPEGESDAGAVPGDAAAPGSEGIPGDGAGADDATGLHPATGVQSPTALRNATAPRAVLRPVPDGFPTPPPRPARPNRRPAPKVERAAQPSRRGPLIASLLIVIVLVLVVAIGGSILAYRALSPDPSSASDPATATGDTSGSGEVAIGDVTAREVSTEVGVRQLGNGASESAKPEGEFVVVIVEIDNASASSVTFEGTAALETADGETHAPDADAAEEYVGGTESFGIVNAGESASFHLVYDVPVGSEPSAVQLAFPSNPDAGSGSLPVGG
jgi:Domain of unknown function (DUF4352)